MRRCLAASGKDFQMWSGPRRTKDVFERLRPELEIYEDENGVELFGLPRLPLPDDDVPAPVSFLPGFDNLILAYAGRARMMTDEQRRVVCDGAVTYPTLPVDGRVPGIWALKHERKTGCTALTLDLFAPLPDEKAVCEEAARLLEFAVPDAEHRVGIA